jgi:GT2 family glycosyltransferase
MAVVSIGVAVVNLNGREDTLACLESLFAAHPRPARVVVVDNASTDDSVRAVEEWIGSHEGCGIEVVVADSNRGFAGANNLALARLVADRALTHFFLLNNDARVDARCFAEIQLALAERPAAGILGTTIYAPGAPHRVWYAGGSIRKWTALGRHHDRVPHGGPAVLPTEFVSGCAMLIARPVWRALGPLPECYFIYFEDAEYSLRAAAAGYEVLYAPRPVVWHLIAGAVRRGAVGAATTEYRFAKSRMLFARRNLRGAQRRVAVAYLMMVGLSKALLRTLRGRPVRAWTAFRGTVDGLLSDEGHAHAAPSATRERAGEQVVADK